MAMTRAATNGPNRRTTVIDGRPTAPRRRRGPGPTCRRRSASSSPAYVRRRPAAAGGPDRRAGRSPRRPERATSPAGISTAPSPSRSGRPPTAVDTSGTPAHSASCANSWRASQTLDDDGEIGGGQQVGYVVAVTEQHHRRVERGDLRGQRQKRRAVAGDQRPAARACARASGPRPRSASRTPSAGAGDRRRGSAGSRR